MQEGEREEISQGTDKIWPEREHHDVDVKMAEFNKEGMPGRPNETKLGKGRPKKCSWSV